MPAGERYDLVKRMCDVDFVAGARLPSLPMTGTFPFEGHYYRMQFDVVECSEVGSPSGE